MQTMTAGYNSLGLLLRLNWDRFFYIGAIGAALLAGAAIGTLVTG
ncbi:hypothetical protein [Tropicimonas sp. IMCC6043]|nr:hypothetical protein [Tropicimonas sp. IMCC6043]